MAFAFVARSSLLRARPFVVVSLPTAGGRRLLCADVGLTLPLITRPRLAPAPRPSLRRPPASSRPARRRRPPRPRTPSTLSAPMTALKSCKRRRPPRLIDKSTSTSPRRAQTTNPPTRRTPSTAKSTALILLRNPSRGSIDYCKWFGARALLPNEMDGW